MSLPLIGWLSSIRRSGRTGPLRSEAALVHGGQTTQVWDAQVTRGDGRTAGVFRCT
jgi:acyl-coenzyme A thioesterase PaaI-like protein